MVVAERLASVMIQTLVPSLNPKTDIGAPAAPIGRRVVSENHSRRFRKSAIRRILFGGNWLLLEEVLQTSCSLLLVQFEAMKAEKIGQKEYKGKLQSVIEDLDLPNPVTPVGHLVTLRPKIVVIFMGCPMFRFRSNNRCVISPTDARR
jgi:hypothetical protein